MARYGPPPHLYEFAGMDPETRVALGEPNRACRCRNPMASMVCVYGHMLECHYPQTCDEAECSHFQAYEAAEGEL